MAASGRRRARSASTSAPSSAPATASPAAARYAGHGRPGPRVGPGRRSTSSRAPSGWGCSRAASSSSWDKFYTGLQQPTSASPCPPAAARAAPSGTFGHRDELPRRRLKRARVKTRQTLACSSQARSCSSPASSRRSRSPSPSPSSRRRKAPRWCSPASAGRCRSPSAPREAPVARAGGAGARRHQRRALRRRCTDDAQEALGPPRRRAARHRLRPRGRAGRQASSPRRGRACSRPFASRPSRSRSWRAGAARR